MLSGSCTYATFTYNILLKLNVHTSTTFVKAAQRPLEKQKFHTSPCPRQLAPHDHFRLCCTTKLDAACVCRWCVTTIRYIRDLWMRKKQPAQASPRYTHDVIMSLHSTTLHNMPTPDCGRTSASCEFGGRVPARVEKSASGSCPTYCHYNTSPYRLHTYCVLPCNKYKGKLLTCWIQASWPHWRTLFRFDMALP